MLVSETEVQASISYILRRFKIIRPFFGGHRIPNFISLVVSPNIVQLCAGIQEDEVNDTYCNECAISSAVAWRIVFAVDVGGDDTRGLHKHVVDRSVDCTRGDSS